MRPVPGLILLVLLAGLHVPSADAQDSLAVAGVRVRVHTSAAPLPVIGRLVAADSTSLHVEISESRPPVELLRASVSRFEVSRGKVNRPAQGAMLGWSIGMVTGTLLGIALQDRSESEFDFPSSGNGMSPLVTGVLGAGGGLLLGLLVGSSIRRERWVPEELPPGTAP